MNLIIKALVLLGIASWAHGALQGAALRLLSDQLSNSLVTNFQESMCRSFAASAYYTSGGAGSDSIDVPRAIELCKRHVAEVHAQSSRSSRLVGRDSLASTNVTGAIAVALEVARTSSLASHESLRAFSEGHAVQSAGSGPMLAARSAARRHRRRQPKQAPSPVLIELGKRISSGAFRAAVQASSPSENPLNNLLGWMTGSGFGKVTNLLMDKDGRLGSILGDEECLDMLMGAMDKSGGRTSTRDRIAMVNEEAADIAKGSTRKSFENAVNSIADFIGALLSGETKNVTTADIASARLRDYRPYNEQEARFAAYWSSLAYMGTGLNMADFYKPELCSHTVFGSALKDVKIVKTFVVRDWYGNDNYAVVGWSRMPPTFNKPVLVVAFSGTRTGAQLLDEIKFGAFQTKFSGFRDSKVQDASVSGYFLDAWTRLEREMVPVINRELCDSNGTNPQVFITGHSLGGALSTMAAVRLEALLGVAEKTKKWPIVITLGSPRVGNWQFAHEYMKLPMYTYRITHNRDPIPVVPACPLYINRNNHQKLYACDEEKAKSSPGYFWHVAYNVHYPRHTMPDFMAPPYNTTDPAKATGTPMKCTTSPDGESPSCVDAGLPQDWATVPDSKRCAVLLNWVEEGTADHVIYFGYGVPCACNFFLPPPFGLRGFPTEYNPCRTNYIPTQKKTFRGDQREAAAVQALVGRFDSMEIHAKKLLELGNLTSTLNNLDSGALQKALLTGSLRHVYAGAGTDADEDPAEDPASSAGDVVDDVLAADAGGAGGGAGLDAEAARLEENVARASTQAEVRAAVAKAQRLAESPDVAEEVVRELDERLESGGERAAAELHSAVTQKGAALDAAISTLGAATTAIAADAHARQVAGEDKVAAMRGALTSALEGRTQTPPTASTEVTEQDRVFLPADMPMGRPGLPGQGIPVV